MMPVYRQTAVVSIHLSETNSFPRRKTSDDRKTRVSTAEPTAST